MFSSRSLSFIDKLVTADRSEFKHLKDKGPLHRKCHGKINMIGSSECTIKQTTEDEINLFVWGNSHAESFFPVAKKYAQMQGNISVTLLSTSSFPAILDFEGTNHWHKARDGQAYHQKAFELIKESKLPFSVVYSSRWTEFFLSEEEKSLIMNKVPATIQRLVDVGAQTIYIPLPMIEFEQYPPKCILKNLDCSVDMKEFSDKRREIVAFLESLKSQFKAIKLIDILPLTCPQGRCPVLLDGEPVNYDLTHMTPRMGEKIMTLNPGLFDLNTSKEVARF